MKQKKIEDLKKWFTGYVLGYYTGDKKTNDIIRLKSDHTLRVCENIILIGEKLNIPAQELILAEISALLHDIGRFRQYAVYGTFNDSISENHAKLSLKEIASQNVLDGFDKDKKRLISQAIAYHNLAILPGQIDETVLFFTRLLRDADKLDIWKVFGDYFNKPEQRYSDTFNSIITLAFPDEPVYSQKILNAFPNKRIASLQDIKTLNDFKLLQISWVFDLNYRPSFQLLQQRKLIDQIVATLPQSRKILSAVEQAYQHVDQFANYSDKIT